MGRTPVDKIRLQNLKKQNEIAAKLSSEFFEKGFLNVSTEDLCLIAGKSKATLYKYFESKEDMIQYITSNKLKEISGFVEKLNNENNIYPVRYKEAVELVLSSLNGISFTFLSELKIEYPGIFKTLIELKENSILLLTNFYSEGVKAEAFKDFDPKLLAALDDMFFTTMLETDFLNNKSYSVKQLFEQYFKTRFEGLLK
ncbi:MAG: TetR/AcrR family transcriptional regulator [Flavobacteriales bacterium]|nr:TetR/AcrR family transcriptional regulator [Flavobacteriales bacterium]